VKADAENRNTPAPRLPPPELQASQSSISSSRVGINVVREYQEEWSQLNILQRRYQPSSNDTLPILKPPLVSPSNLGSAISDQRPKLGGVHNAVIQSPGAFNCALSIFGKFSLLNFWVFFQEVLWLCYLN